ncbi:uncharacterized protein EV420DRAFT_1278094 [Desarmillaria tabescens]|uniref:RING-type domain-containing protein n=1 Tax=Armillaria tabescens TaxID=1929756 RepID=A0AA39MQQ7_ARMTA|nr:uncharacterized protein EV420DRAFT_1278094 [Desarmillaria tabescens]KAK0443117.1 hypothetical protein EV420DRAFT_1278094 [Desarmillaria tabescens]
MLCLGSGSTCDVCLEPFGNDTKAPCSIECGHVFCLNCLNQITRLKCPLCRSRFEPQGFVKLHIDVDDVRSSSHSPERPPSASPAELEARRLQEAIANIANEGSTEASLRQLIQDCKSFLAGQPRNLFTELRFIHRVVSYLCDVKSDLVKTKRELAHLTTEKARSDQMVADLEADMKRDRRNAQALEDNLRDYCSKAQGAYFGVAE